MIDFGDAVQVFHVGARRCGTYGMPAGIASAASRFGTTSLADLAAPAIAFARDGVEVNRTQALLWDLLGPIAVATRGVARALLRRRGASSGGPGRARPGSRRRDRAAGQRGRGAVLHRRHRRGGVGLGVRAGRDAGARGPGGLRDDRRASRCGSRYHGREVLTNPPPSAGGLLIAYALALLERGGGKPGAAEIVAAMEAAQAERTPEFLDHLHGAGFTQQVHELAARLDHSRLGARRRRLGVLGDDHERRGLGDRHPGHRHPRQQHDGRGGPLARGLVHASAGAAAAVDDGADGRAATTARRSWSSARPAPTGSAARSCR